MSIYPSGVKSQGQASGFPDNQSWLFSDANLVSDEIEKVRTTSETFTETVLFDGGNKTYIHNQNAEINLTLSATGTTAGEQTRTYYIYGDGVNNINTDFDSRIQGDVLTSSPVIYNKLVIEFNGDLTGDVINKITAKNTQVVIAQDVTSGLLFKYLLNGDSTDSSGNANDGTDNGSVTYVNDDIRGTVAEIDGTVSTSYINSGLTTDGGSYTKTIWVRIPDPSLRDMHAFSGVVAGNKTTLWNSGGSWKAGNQTSVSTAGGGLVSVNNWQFMVATYDSTLDEIKIYTDAVLKDTKTETDSTGAPLFLGRHNADSTQLIGKLSDARYYNRVLTADEILNLYYFERK